MDALDKKGTVDLHLKNLSPDLGCSDERILLTIPTWNIELEKRYREHYFNPFIDTLRKLDEKDVFNWFLDTIDFTNTKKVSSKSVINQAR